MMIRPVMLGLLAWMATAGFGAQAQVNLDVSKITCKQFAAYKVANPKYVAIWISGYYYGTQKKFVVDTQRLVENADKLENYCLKNPDTLVIQAIETVLGPLP